MPACINCPFYNAAGNVCMEYDQREYKPGDPHSRPLSRGCVNAIAKLRLPELTGRVLEIGPGATKTPRRILAEHGKAEWYGIDPVFRRPTGNAMRGTAAKIPVADAFFDAVFGLETIEHWEEYGETVPENLREIARVLVPGGLLLLSAPIHQHGSVEFIRGDIPAIVGHFGPEWADVQLEPWRKDFEPLPPSEEYRYWGGGKYCDLVLAGTDMSVPSSWCLEIRARKKL